jgi:hypothetical protein
MKATKEPATVAEARINQPSHIPYTKPAVVPQAEYPIMGGNAVQNVINQRIIHPPVVFFHFSAYGWTKPNIFSLKTRKRIPRTLKMTSPATSRTFCNVLRRFQIFRNFRYSCSAVFMRLSRTSKDERRSYGDRAPLDVDRLGGCHGLNRPLLGEGSGEAGRVIC